MSIEQAVAAERERCAKIADEHSDSVLAITAEMRSMLDAQNGITYSMGYEIAADRIAAKIRGQ